MKWRNWKLVFYEETRDWFGTPQKLTLPKLFNLTTDPKEEYPEVTLRNTWVMTRCLEAVRSFFASLGEHPAIPEGTRGTFDPEIHRQQPSRPDQPSAPQQPSPPQQP